MRFISTIVAITLICLYPQEIASFLRILAHELSKEIAQYQAEWQDMKPTRDLLFSYYGGYLEAYWHNFLHPMQQVDPELHATMSSAPAAFKYWVHDTLN
jgi:hypothetical protein